MVSDHRKNLTGNQPIFVTDESFASGTTCVLNEDATRHIRVLRLEVGAHVGLRDGQGAVGEGKLVRLARSQAHVEVSHVEMRELLPAVHLLVPVADRDRLLWLAEKAAELACTSWRPVLWRRSRSVAPRGEGMAFQARVRARMAGALAQSHGAWLPQMFPEANLERAILATPSGERIVLDAAGSPLVGDGALPLRAPLVFALGPEGGLEADELAALSDAGFRSARLGPTILRFETAGLAALAMARTALSSTTGATHE